ncbi:interferon epsilon [Mixophyes fleayi]|uniref:interferon epsilon n=1 Tax=Mixophyes fleayi TaxID=3061075 RepID=UPI003F4DE068
MAGVSTIRLLETLGSILLLIFCSTGESSHECYRNLPFQRQMNKEAFRLLEKLNQTQYPECQQRKATFNLSESLNKMVKVPPEMLRTLLRYTEKLFRNNMMPATEDKEKENITDRLRSVLFTMSQAWTECVYRQMMQSTANLPKLTWSTRKITVYFLRMEDYLKTEAHNQCAWASVSAEVEKVLIFVSRQTDRLIRDINKTQRS